MRMTHGMRRAGLALLLGIGVLAPLAVSAHCDALDGPVVIDARAALATGDAIPLLKWVRAEDAETITDAFTRTLAVRKLGPDAQILADTWFFETLVRVHRASEGAPYTGLKPAGTIAPAVAAADNALATGEIDALVARVTAHMTHGMRQRFARATELRARAGNSVEDGRAYVAAYVDYVHYIQGLHQAVAGGGHHGGGEHREAPAAAHPHQGHAEAGACNACR